MRAGALGKHKAPSTPCSLAGICLLIGLGLDTEEKFSTLAYLQIYHSGFDGVIPRVQISEAENILPQAVSACNSHSST